MIELTEDEIHYSNKRLQAVKRRLAKFEENYNVAVNFINAMTTHGIKVIRIAQMQA